MQNGNHMDQSCDKVLHQQMNDYQLIQSFSTFLNFIQLIKDKFVY